MTTPVTVTNANWATEQTLIDILRALESQQKLSAKAYNEILKELKKSGLEKASGRVVKEVSSYAPENKNINNKSKNHENEDTPLKKAQKKYTDKLKEATVSTFKFTGVLSGAISGLTKLRNAATSFKSFVYAGILTPFALAVGKALEYYNVSLDLERAGVASVARTSETISSSLGSLGETAKKARITFGEMIAITEKYSSSVGTAGIEFFADTVSNTTKDLRKFAVTSKESATFTARYLEQQKKAGMLGDFDKLRLQHSISESMKQTIRFANALKMSREEILKRQEESLNTLDTKFLRSRLDSAGIEIDNGLRGVASMLGPELTATIVSATDAYVFRNTAMASNRMQKLAEQGGYPVAQLFEEIAEKLAVGKNIDPEWLQGRVKGLGRSIDDIAGKLGPEANEIKAALVNLREFSSVYAKSLADRIDENATSRAILNDKMREVTGHLQNVFAKVVSTPAFTNAVTNFVDNGIVPLTNAIIKAEPVITGTIQKISDWLANDLKNLSIADIIKKSLTVALGSVAGYIAGYHGTKLAYSAGKNIFSSAEKGTKGVNLLKSAPGILKVFAKRFVLVEAAISVFVGSISGFDAYTRALKEGQGKLYSVAKGISSFTSTALDTFVGGFIDFADLLTFNTLNLKDKYKKAKKIIKDAMPKDLGSVSVDDADEQAKKYFSMSKKELRDAYNFYKVKENFNGSLNRKDALQLKLIDTALGFKLSTDKKLAEKNQLKQDDINSMQIRAEPSKKESGLEEAVISYFTSKNNQGNSNSNVKNNLSTSDTSSTVIKENSEETSASTSLVQNKLDNSVFNNNEIINIAAEIYRILKNIDSNTAEFSSRVY